MNMVGILLCFGLYNLREWISIVIISWKVIMNKLKINNDDIKLLNDWCEIIIIKMLLGLTNYSMIYHDQVL